MAILIYNMEMPTGCKDCPMMMEYTSTGETVCIASQEILAYPYQTIQFDGKPDWCPLREVVRCKDCRHKVLTKDGEYDPEDIVCDYWMSDGLDSNDFCSMGERREK